MPRVLGLIPARGGSKGIPRKNLADVGGHPLLAYTIAPALAANGALDSVILSTDDEEIAAAGAALGAEVPFLRPAHLGGDTASTIDVVLHALDHLEQQGRSFDAVVLLQPTSPQRTREDIEKALEIYAAGSEPSLISAYEAGFYLHYLYTRSGERAIPLAPGHATGTRRQDLECLLVRNGAIYITATSHLREYRSFVSEQPLLLLMDEKRSINIDSPSELERFREFINREGRQP